MSTNTYKIFLVDDDVKTLIMFKHNLDRRLSYPVAINVFAYGENCLDRMQEDQPDIVVLDYYLNAIRENAQTGLEVLQQIKQLSPKTQVVMISGQEDMETAIECIRHGAYDYIIKNANAMQRLELVINKILHETQNAK